MVKIVGTRKQKAQELLRLVETGPAFRPALGEDFMSETRAEERYREWAANWLIPLIEKCVPELHYRNDGKIKPLDEATKTNSV